MKNDRCAFLMSTCDTYKDTWYPFFELMKKYWCDIPYPIYVNTEYEKLTDFTYEKYGFEINSLNLQSGLKKQVPWGKRLIEAIERIEEPYVFLVLDDFFITDFVQTEYIEKILDIMDSDEEIASFQISASRFNYDYEKKSMDEFILKYHQLDNSGWKTHFVPTIWRKTTLLKWLRPYESIWGFELYGSNRARRWNYKDKVYVVEQPYIYKYMWIDGCSVVLNGKWLDNQLVDKIFCDNNVDINFNERGRITLEEYRNRTKIDTLKKYKFNDIIIKLINRMRSYF